jgi:hypothetical protein
LVDQAADAGLLAGPREGACYYMLSQSDTLGSSIAFALLGEKVGTSGTRRELPRKALLDRLRLLPGAFLYAPYVPAGLLGSARLAMFDGVRMSELRGVHPPLPSGVKMQALRVVVSRDALLLLLTRALEPVEPRGVITRSYAPGAVLDHADNPLSMAAAASQIDEPQAGPPARLGAARPHQAAGRVPPPHDARRPAGTRGRWRGLRVAGLRAHRVRRA